MLIYYSFEVFVQIFHTLYILIVLFLLFWVE